MHNVNSHDLESCSMITLGCPPPALQKRSNILYLFFTPVFLLFMYPVKVFLCLLDCRLASVSGAGVQVRPDAKPACVEPHPFLSVLLPCHFIPLPSTNATAFSTVMKSSPFSVYPSQFALISAHICLMFTLSSSSPSSPSTFTLFRLNL